jgi:DNA processing protein
LIRQGAKLVASWQDVVEELPHPIREKIFAPLVAQMQAAPEPQLEGDQSRVWKALSLQEATSIDTLLAKLSLPTSEVYSALLALEMAGHIRQLPGKKYIRRL